MQAGYRAGPGTTMGVTTPAAGRLERVASHVAVAAATNSIYGTTGDQILAGRLEECHDDLSLTFGPQPGPSPRRPPAAPAALLSDKQVQDFITQGFVLLNVDIGDGGLLHHRVVEALDRIRSRTPTGKLVPPAWEAEPSGGVPGLRQLFDDAGVRGALTSLLGPEYMLNPHHHIHLREPGATAQTWHKDAYVFDNNVRQPRFRWLFFLYYPNDCTAEGGPTALQPGRHNHMVRPYPVHSVHGHVLSRIHVCYVSRSTQTISDHATSPVHVPLMAGDLAPLSVASNRACRAAECQGGHRGPDQLRLLARRRCVHGGCVPPPSPYRTMPCVWRDAREFVCARARTRACVRAHSLLGVCMYLCI